MKLTSPGLMLFLALGFSSGCFQTVKEKTDFPDPVDFVNPYMGNISHLLVPTYPTIHLPNSMLRVYPERNDYTGDVLNGLPLVITSHRGSSSFNFSPYQGSDAGLKPVVPFSYDLEEIKPYAYHVYLDEQKSKIDFAVSHQAAVYEITFNGEGPVSLIINSKEGELSWNGSAVSGYQRLQNNTRVYLYLEPDIRPLSIGVLGKKRLVESKATASGHNACMVLKYSEKVSSLKVRYGISYINEEQARKNLNREVPLFDVDALAAKGRQIWNEALGKIKVKGGSVDGLTIFYTSLYRTFERPVCISEDGQYFSAFDGMVHNDEGTPFYTDDWIWDTYRAAHPLRVMIEPEKEMHIINSFIRMAEQMDNFWMPTFPEITGDSRRMNSNHAVATVIDAYSKGLTGFDLEKAYNACKNAITQKTLAPWSGKPAGELDRFYRENGYIPALNDGEAETIPEVHHFERRQPVAVTLGTSYDEWCLAQIARLLGKTDDYHYFLKCSYNYRNLFNPETKFFHPKNSKGEFIQPFSYVFSGGQGARGFYGENNAWIYRWDVQHNIADLVQLMGGRESFTRNLDSMFNEPLGKSKFEFFAQLPDHTGNVGQFSMANEPSLHIPYLYNYAGQPWKVQKRIRALLQEWFRNDLMGLPGDEDGGGMSAFVAFSQLGFYPVTPGMPIYNIGSPAFEESSVRLGNGKEFRIIARNCSESNKYIQSAKLNGQDWDKPWFRHDDIKNGGVLELIMGDKARKDWGSAPDNAPLSSENISETTDSVIKDLSTNKNHSNSE
jgi:predicted alpha-1,2-mannosidase